MSDDSYFFGQSGQESGAEQELEKRKAYTKDLIHSIEAEISELQETMKQSEVVSKEMSELTADIDIAEVRRNATAADLKGARDFAMHVAGMFGIDPEALNFDLLDQPSLDGGDIETNEGLGKKRGKFRDRPMI